MPSQINPVHYTPSYFFKIYFNINLPSQPRSSKQSIPFKFSNHNPDYLSLLPDFCHTLCLSPSPSHFHVNNISWDPNWKALHKHPPVPSYFPTITPTYLPHHPTVNTLSSSILNISKTMHSCNAMEVAIQHTWHMNTSYYVNLPPIILHAFYILTYMVNNIFQT